MPTVNSVDQVPEEREWGTQQEGCLANIFLEDDWLRVATGGRDL